MDQQPLVTISEASQILGVSEAALRQWTDEGKIRAFITPGGHRRYAKAELKRFMGSHHRVLGIKDLVIELENTTNLLGEVARTSPSTTVWYNKLSRDSQEDLARLGRSLLNLIVRYVTEPAKREETIKLARDVGRGFGETLAKSGLPLINSVEAFILNRYPIMNAATHLLQKREAFTRRVVEAIPLVAQVMDEALVSLVEAHQQY
ncbi:MAG TPA: helix-turn-helix domain-containing protein [Dehalococcoidia bacterium]|nr:helix-turn-helix domain-containing protein [Dehalococcoidia bacterium]